MPGHQETYQRVVIRARFAFRGVPPRDRWEDLTPLEQDVAAQMVEDQGEAAFRGANQGFGDRLDEITVAIMIGTLDAFPQAPLNDDNVDEVVQQVREAFARGSVEAESALTGGVSDAYERMAQAHKRALTEAASEAGTDVGDDVLVGIVQRVRQRTEGRRVSDRMGAVVLRRAMTDAADDTESFIRDNVGRPGRETARQLLNDLATDADGETYTRIGQAIENAGPRGERVRRAIQRAGRAGEDLDSGGRNMYVNAKRAMAHELNQASHEADVLAAHESPAVKALRWRVSARHPVLESSPDVCDVLAEYDAHGLGPGLYHPGSAPSLPHPYCQCAVLPETVDPDEWGDIEYNDDQTPNTEPQPIEQNRAAAILRRNLTAANGSVTAAKIRRTVDVLNQRTAIAYDEFIDF